MSSEAKSFILIFICILFIGFCQYGNKESLKNAKRFWYSALIAEIAALFLSATNIVPLQVILAIIAVSSSILSIIFCIQLYKEAKGRRSE